MGGTVTSPLVTVPSSGTLVATFKAWIDTESSNFFDTVQLNVIPASGLPVMVWEKTDSHMNFEEYEADISAFSGQTVQFQFAFDSSDTLMNDTEGVYIDDFSVESTCATSGGAQGNDYPTLFDIWGSDPNNIFTVGSGGFVARYNGQTWSEIDFSDLVGPWKFKGLFGFADSLYAVGDAGLVMKKESGALAGQNSGSAVNFKSVWGNSGSDVYAVGEAGTILYNGGMGWSKEAVGVVTNLNGVWGAGSFEVVAVGDEGTILRKEDGLWQPEPSGTSVALHDVWGLGSKNTWAVGDQGTILRFEGDMWVPEPSPTVYMLNSISGTSNEQAWAVGGNGVILNYNGVSWTDASSVITQDWYDVWALDDGTAIVVGALGLIIRGDGEVWSQMSQPMGSAAIESIWGRAANDLYAAGDGFILHYDGNEEGVWKLDSSTVQLQTWRGICGSGPDNVLIVGGTTRVLRWNGVAWSMVPVEPETEATADAPAEPYTQQLHGCWTIDEDTAWAVGEGGLIFELVDGEFVKAENLIPVSLRDVFAYSKDLVFAVGIEGVILSSRGIGSTWLPIYSGSVAGLFGIFGTALENITAVGDLGTVQRFLPFYDALGESPPTILEEVEEEVEESEDGSDEESSP